MRVLWFLIPAMLCACGTDPWAGSYPTADAPQHQDEALLIWEDTAVHCGPFSMNAPNAEGTCFVDGARVRNFGETVFSGHVDVTACVARVLAGARLPYKHDGTIFRNAERRLPAAPVGFYQEYVAPTPGLQGPGPQRLVWGGHSDWYYTPDHYETFLPVKCVL